ncbi:MAG: right-handed parallel beta-helix repeat-containing protein [bacterium]
MRVILALAVACVGAGSALAREWVVAPDGDDDALGTAAAPLRTLAAVCALATNGDLCLVRPGRYLEPLRPAKSGRAGRPIRFVSASEGRAVLARPDDCGSTGSVRVAKRAYGVDLTDRAQIEVLGFTLDGVAATLAGARHCLLDGVTIRGVTAEWGALATNSSGASTPAALAMGGSDNEFRGGTIAACDVAAVVMAPDSTGQRIVNSLIEEVGRNGDAALFVTGAGAQVLHCTVRRCGGQALDAGGLRNGLIEFNDLSGGGRADGTALVTLDGDGRGTAVAWNWIHDARGAAASGLRLAGAQNMIVHHNVIWNIPGAALRVEAPGGWHVIYHNTTWATGVSVALVAGAASTNRLTLTACRFVNNLLPSGIETAPALEMRFGVWQGNATNPVPGFVNAADGDFRLTAQSPCVDAGAQAAEVLDEYVGTAPDPGAYEFGRPDWVAGCERTAIRRQETGVSIEERH